MSFNDADEDERETYELLHSRVDERAKNAFASNFITMDQIINFKSDYGKSMPGNVSNGWESDASATSSPAPAETEDEREERERKEFMDAIRAARGQSVQQISGDATAGISSSSGSKVGRMYGDDDDADEEEGVTEKQKSALELLEEAKRGKELRPVDHSKIEYAPFRKNLYIVPKALSKLSEQEVQDKRDDLQVKIRPKKGVPAPVDTWEQCGLSERILQIIQKYDLKAPFAIQKQAIPTIMCGRDIIGVAKTGSGKTLAFLLPMLRHIQDQSPLRDGEGPIGLVMAPARELAFQIYNEAKKFTRQLGLRVACIYGGAGVAEQIADLKRGADIVVCTPGRMIDILCMQAGKLISLARVTMVVMDEADRMFDMGFEPQIKMIIQNIRPDRQTVLFSATFPKQIEGLAKSVLKFPVEILVGERSSVNKDITQLVEIHDEQDKFLRLLQLLGLWYDKGSVLIFVDKQEKCDQLYQELTRCGYPCLSLHGGKDQLDRDHTLHEFKSLVKTVMIATSVAGRGLDVPEIALVINYNCPNHLEDYVHRVGRTGRAGRKGTAYTFLCEKDEQYSPLMIRALERADVTPPPELVEMARVYKEKVDRGEAKNVTGGIRSGKGFTFDADEMNEAQRMASMQRRQYDLEQGIIDEGDGQRGEEELEGVEGEKGLASDGQQSPLERAVAIANHLALSKGLPAGTLPLLASLALSASFRAATDATTLSIDARQALERARKIALKMGSSGSDGKNHFADELEINEYPATARRKINSKNAFDEIIERTGVNIIQRGIYIAPGKPVAAGERKLHLLIEGPNDLAVRQAKIDIVRLLEEETMKVSASSSSGSGRYSVL